MKHKDGNFIQLSRAIFGGEYKCLSDSAKWLYCYLSELEHKYTSDKNNNFINKIMKFPRL